MGGGAVGDGFIGAAGAFPSPVAVHGIVAADQGAEPDIIWKRFQKGRKVIDCIFRQHVAAVGKAMDDDLRPVGGKSRDHGQHLFAVRMHAAGRHQAHDMDPSAFPELLGKGGEIRMSGKRAVGKRGVDPRQVLHDDAAGTYVHVPDLGIADLAVRKPDIRARCRKPCMRPARKKRVIGRGCGHRHRIGVGGIAKTPPVHDAKYDGMWLVGRLHWQVAFV